MNELKFVMLAKKFEEFSEYFDDFYELLGTWTRNNHSDNEDAYLTGITGISNGKIDYSWERRGCSRGCCGYISGEDTISVDDLLQFIQEQNDE